MSPRASPLAAPRPQPARGAAPRHVAIIMDGNGRWATRRHLPRVAGHARGVDVVRGIVQACAERGIEYLTIFAFSSENWRRPPDEVSVLMRLFVTALQREMAKLQDAGVRLHVVGHLESFDPALRRLIAEAEQSTAANTRLHLSVCASYGGRWDIVQAVNALLDERRARGEDPAAPVTEADLEQRLVLAYAPPPDLLIRTGAERRISNFLLWQCAYAELYFTDQLWPEFDVVSLDAALDWYAQRERRFGRTTAQVAGGERPAARESA